MSTASKEPYDGPANGGMTERSELMPVVTTPAKPPSQASEEIVQLGKAFGPVLTQLVKSQETSAKEATKQAEIAAATMSRMYYGLFGIALAVILVAGCALFLKETALTEKVIIGLFGFLAGFGSGKGLSGRQH